jgi:hypothetical protein
VILQLDPPIPVTTEHGDGMALLVIDYGHQWNTVWVVALKNTLEIKHYDAAQLKMERNFTFGYAPV